MAPPSGEETPNPYPLTDNTENTSPHLPSPLSTGWRLNTTQLKINFLEIKKLFMACLGDTHNEEEIV
jgi:hypothetical protein